MHQRQVIIVDLDTLKSYNLTTSEAEIQILKDQESFVIIDHLTDAQLLRTGWEPIGEARIQSDGELVTTEK